MKRFPFRVLTITALSLFIIHRPALSSDVQKSFAAQETIAPAPTQHSVKAKELLVSRRGDLEMSCGGLSQEAALMRDIVNVTEETQNISQRNSRGVEVAGAVGTFLVGTATGGLGLAAAGYLAKSIIDEDYDLAENVQDIAAQRRSFMMGIYNAKGCYGPIEHVIQSPEPSPEHFVDIAPASGEETSQAHEGFNQ